MSAENENTESFPFDGGRDAWIAAFQTAKPGRPGDVLLLVTDTALKPEAFANWKTVFSCLVNVNGEAMYGSFHCLLPPSHKHFIEAIEETCKDEGAPPFVFHEVVTAELKDLERVLLALPEGCAALLLGIEAVRASGNVTNAPDSSTQSWTGITHRMRSQDEIHRFHLQSVVASVIDIALDRKIFVTAMCELPSLIASGLPQAVGDPESLIVMTSEPGPRQLLTQQFVSIMQRVRSGASSLEQGLKEVEDLIEDPSRRSLAQSQLQFGNGLFEAAWKGIKPHLSQFQNEGASILLGIGHTAFAAMQRDEATNFLKAALAAGINTFGDIQTAYLLAQQLDDSNTRNALLTRMTVEYPNEEITIDLQYQTALEKAEYREAEKLARRLNLDFEAEVWKEFSQPTLDLDDIAERAQRLGKTDQLAGLAALEYARRDDLDMAAIWASKVQQGSKYEVKAMRIRIRAFAKGTLGTRGLTDQDVAELLPLLDFVAHNPTEQPVRAALDRAFEEDIGELDAIVILAAALHQLIPTTAAYVATARTDTGVIESDPDDALDFFKRALQSINTPILALGHGVLPQDLAREATPALVRNFLLLIQHSKFSDETPQHSYALLKIMELLCLEAKDPSSDIEAGQMIVQRLIASAGMQAARDLAEEILRALPARQQQYRRWRQGLAWVAYGEAFARSGNITAALRYLCLAMSMLRAEIVDVEVFCHVLRICTRVFRDLKLAPLAISTLEAERRIRTSIGATDMLWQLDQVELSIRVLEAATRRERMKLLLDSMRQLRALPKGEDKLPLLSIAVSLVRIARFYGVWIPTSLRDELSLWLADQSGYYSKAFQHLLLGRITKDELLNLIDPAGRALRWDDLSSQLQPVQLVAEDAIEFACETQDEGLFTVAISLLCQPVLSLQSANPDDGGADSGKLRVWALQQLAEGRSAQQLADLAALLQGAGPRELHSLASVCRTTIGDLRAVLAPSEAVLFIAEGASGAACLCYVAQDGSCWLRRLSKDFWSSEETHIWRQNNPNGYGRKSAPGGSGWSIDQVHESLKSLNLDLRIIPMHLTIIPSANLFSFPFSLTDVKGKFLGTQTRIAIAPSATWLVRARKTNTDGAGSIKAWLGAPASADPVISYAHKYISPLLTARGVDVLRLETPDGLQGSRAAILLTHGVRGGFQHFRSVTDGRYYHSPSDIAKHLQGCSFVVLLVCYGAHAAVPTHTNETRGMVAALLGAGVRCVIASAWPITVETVQYWLPAFLDMINTGHSLGESADAAARDVRTYIADAAAWASLQLYGDATLTLQSPIL